LNLAPFSRFKISKDFLVWFGLVWFVIVEMSTSTIGTKLPEQAKWTKTNPISSAQIAMWVCTVVEQGIHSIPQEQRCYLHHRWYEYSKPMCI
jgi:hypothetical protein